MIVHDILHDVTSPKAHAALIALNNQLKIQDIDYIEHLSLRQKLIDGVLNKTKIKSEFLKGKKLICSICKRDLITTITPKSKTVPDNLATIDHITPLSAGGLRYSFRNMLILCHKCNNDKGSKRVVKTSDGSYLIIG